jgi:hypothetical protein
MPGRAVMRAAYEVVDQIRMLVGEDATLDLLQELRTAVRAAVSADASGPCPSCLSRKIASVDPDGSTVNGVVRPVAQCADCQGFYSLVPTHPAEPPGVRVECPRCDRVEYVTLDPDVRPGVLFRLVSPFDKGTATLGCPCGVEFEVTEDG